MKKGAKNIMLWIIRRLLMVAIIFCIAIFFSFIYSLSEIQPAVLKGFILFAFAAFAIIIFGNEYRDFEHKKIFKPILDIFAKDISLIELFKLFVKWLALSIIAFFANRLLKNKLPNYYNN